MNRAMTIQQRLVIGFALGPLIVAIMSTLIYLDTKGMVERRSLSRHSYDVLLKISEVQTSLLNIETGQRGYLLAGEVRYLEPYEAGKAAVGKTTTELADLVRDNPVQRAHVATLRDLTLQKIAVVDETIVLRRAGDMDGAVAVVRSGRGKAIMDRARGVMEQMHSEEMRLLDQRASEAASLEQATLDTVIIGAFVCFALLAAVAFFTIRAITTPVRSAVEALASASAELLAGATQQAASMRQQASAVAETVSTVDEVLQTSEQAAQRANAVAASSQRASDTGTVGRQAVLNTVGMMDSVSEQSRAIAESILTLSERAQAIGEIIAAVNDIAEQTNLLALNAAIEASRAGEHGLAFGVVASEIKALADQSRTSTGQVRQILGEIQKSTNAAVLVTEEGARGVDRAIATANEAGDTIGSLVDTISEASLAAAQIVASAGQQATGMGQIHQAMSQIKEASNQSLAATRQSEQAAQNLHAVGQSLQAMLGAARR